MTRTITPSIPHYVSIVDYAAGFFLNDGLTWERIRKTWTHLVKDIDRQVIEVRPIPPVLHPNGAEWQKIFQTVFARFRRKLIAVDGNADDARWTSYGLSFQALRDSAKQGRYEHFAYIYKSCINAHKKYLGRANRWGRLQHVEDVKVTPYPDGFEPGHEVDVDLKLDLDDALAMLAPEDAAICRWYLIEGLTFDEIGHRLGGKHRSTVMRRYDKSLETLQVALRDYAEPRTGMEPAPLSVAA